MATFVPLFVRIAEGTRDMQKRRAIVFSSLFVGAAAYLCLAFLPPSGEFYDVTHCNDRNLIISDGRKLVPYDLPSFEQSPNLNNLPKSRPLNKEILLRASNKEVMPVEGIENEKGISVFKKVDNLMNGNDDKAKTDGQPFSVDIPLMPNVKTDIKSTPNVYEDYAEIENGEIGAGKLGNSITSLLNNPSPPLSVLSGGTFEDRPESGPNYIPPKNLTENFNSPNTKKVDNVEDFKLSNKKYLRDEDNPLAGYHNKQTDKSLHADMDSRKTATDASPIEQHVTKHSVASAHSRQDYQKDYGDYFDSVIPNWKQIQKKTFYPWLASSNGFDRLVQLPLEAVAKKLLKQPSGNRDKDDQYTTYVADIDNAYPDNAYDISDGYDRAGKYYRRLLQITSRAKESKMFSQDELTINGFHDPLAGHQTNELHDRSKVHDNTFHFFRETNASESMVFYTALAITILGEMFGGAAAPIVSSLWWHILDYYDRVDRHGEHRPWASLCSAFVITIVSVIASQAPCFYISLGLHQITLHLIVSAAFMGFALLLGFAVPLPSHRVGKFSSGDVSQPHKLYSSLCGDPRAIVMTVTAGIAGFLTASASDFFLWYVEELSGFPINYEILFGAAATMTLLAEVPPRLYVEHGNLKSTSASVVAASGCILMAAFCVLTLAINVAWAAVPLAAALGSARGFLASAVECHGTAPFRLSTSARRTAGAAVLAAWRLGAGIGAVTAGFVLSSYGPVALYRLVAALAVSWAVLLVCIHWFFPTQRHRFYSKLLTRESDSPGGAGDMGLVTLTQEQMSLVSESSEEVEEEDWLEIALRRDQKRNSISSEKT